MMTRKNYQEAARLIREMPLKEADKNLVIAMFVHFFAGDNPNFSNVKFRAACGYDMSKYCKICGCTKAHHNALQLKNCNTWEERLWAK